MVWDGVMARAAAQDLTQLWTGHRLRALAFIPEARDLVFFLDDHAFRWALHPDAGWLTRHPPRAPYADALLVNADVLEVTSPQDERRLTVHLRRPRGTSRRSALHIELASNQRNAVLVDDGGRIRAILTPRSTGKRTLRTGQTYEALPARPRMACDAVDDEAAWAALDSETRRRVMWASPLTRDALGGDRGWALWRTLCDAPTPTWVTFEAKGVIQPYPLSIPDRPGRSHPSLFHAMERARLGGADDAIPAGGASLVDPEIRDRIERGLRRVRADLAALDRERDRLEPPGILRSRGDLLLARLHTVPAGVAQVELEDFDGQVVHLELDPARTPQENASIFYDRAGRAERALDRIPERRRGLLEQERRYQGWLEGLERGEALPEGARAELARAPTDRTQENPLPYRSFWTSGGLEVRVGRGPKANDDLTFHHAAPRDVWLHAQGVPGAHVVLRWDRDDAPPARDLDDAACLAAVHSKARHSGLVPVDWTRRRYVRKPRKAPAGAVVPDRVKTVFVEPDEDRVDRMSRAAPE